MTNIGQEEERMTFTDSMQTTYTRIDGWWYMQGYAPSLPMVRVTDPQTIKRLDQESKEIER